MAVWDFLFGTDPSLEKVETLDPRQKQVATLLAQLLMENAGQPAEMYGGPYGAGPSEAERRAMASVVDLLGYSPFGSGMPALQPGQYSTEGMPEIQAYQAPGGAMPTLEYGQMPEIPAYTRELEERFMSALEAALSGQPSTKIDPQQTEQIIQQIQAPEIRRFEQDILPSVASRFVSGGNFWSRARQEAEARAAADFAAQLSGQAGQIRYSDIQAARELAESAAARQASVVPHAMSYALEAQAQPGRMALAARDQLMREAVQQFEAGLAGRRQASDEALAAFQTSLAGRQQLFEELMRSGSQTFQESLESRRQMADEALAARQAQLQTIGLAGELSARDREMRQRAIENAYNEWVRTRPESLPYMDMMLQFLGIPMVGYYSLPGREGALGQILSALGSIAPAFL